jgi:uncharacterized protein (DUF58 family)
VPTRRGWVVAGGSAGCYLAGWWLGYPELAVLGAGGLLALACAALRLAVPVRLAVLRQVAPIRVPRGDLAVAVVTCVNTGRWRSGPVRALDHCAGFEVAVDLPALPAGGEGTTSYVLPTNRRGQFAVGPLRVVRTDPLGLLRRVRACGEAACLYVVPKTVPVPALASGRVASPEGLRSERAAGGTTTFRSLRPYEFGDELRHVHWRTSARTGTLMVRELVDTSLPRTIVLLDDRAGAYQTPGDFELAVDVAASVALGAARHGYPVSILAGAHVLSSVDAEVLDRLALVGTTDGTDLSAALVAARPRDGAAALVLVTGTKSVDLQRVCSVRATYDRIVVLRAGTPAGPPPVLPVPVVDIAELAALTGNLA